MTSASGKLRERVQFLRRGSTEDAYGNVQTGDLVPVATVNADVLERLGGEKLRGASFDGPRLATIRVRRSAVTRGFLLSDTARMRGEDWNVRSKAEVGRNKEWLEFSLEAGVAT